MKYYNSVWKVAMYIRISNNDGNNESESVANQREIIKKHIDSFDDGDYIIVDEYIDDGISGTTDEKRTAFQRMLKDIQAGLINCVIVKDLARSFRNYSDQGYYLDEWFPRHNVRFISLYHQSLDTLKDNYNIRNIMIPIQGIINENYCAELSVKIRMAKETQRKRGEYTGNWGPYGYIVDSENRHRLAVDPEAAEIVKTIFSMFLDGKSRSDITRYLNDAKVLCPSEYRKKVLQYNYHTYFAEKSRMPLWSSTTVTRILKNQIYCGDMVQGRQLSKSYKLSKVENIPEAEWVIVKNTHDAIIARETFEQAQAILEKAYSPKKKIKHDGLYSGIIFCGDCGKAMYRSNARQKSCQYYCCNTYRAQSRNACTQHYITEDQLNEVVLKAIQQYVYLVCEYERVMAVTDNSSVDKKICKTEKGSTVSKSEEKQRYTLLKRKAYMDWKDGKITRDEYHELKKEYEAIIEGFNDEILEVEDVRKKSELQNDNTLSVIKMFKKYQNITMLTREILQELIQRIEIYEGKINIHFKAKDDLLYLDEQMLAVNNI